jgi:hypothetical protein
MHPERKNEVGFQLQTFELGEGGYRQEIYFLATCPLQFAKAGSAATLPQQKKNNSADVQRGGLYTSLKRQEPTRLSQSQSPSTQPSLRGHQHLIYTAKS